MYSLLWKAVDFLGATLTLLLQFIFQQLSLVAKCGTSCLAPVSVLGFSLAFDCTGLMHAVTQLL